MSLYDPSQAESLVGRRLAYVGPGGFDQHLERETDLRITALSAQDADRLFNEGRVDAIVEEIYTSPDAVRTINLLFPEGELQTTLLVTLLKDHLKSYERELREDREEQLATTVVYVDADVETSPYFAFSYALLVPLLLIIPAFLSGAVAADAMTQEVETRTLEILRSSPAGSRGIFFGKLMAPLTVAPLQGILWILLFDVNGIRIHNPLPILVLLTGFTLLLVSAAVFFGLALKKPGDAQFAYSLLVLLLLGLSYLTPQPLLATFARLAVGSLTLLEVGSIGLTLGAAALGVGLCVLLVPRLIQRLN